MHRILVDLTNIRRLNCGLGQLCLHLGRSLGPLNDEELETSFLVRGPNEGLLKSTGASIEIAHWYDKERFKRWGRPLLHLLPHEPFHLWHATDQFCRFWPTDPRTPVLLTVHDLAFLSTKTSAKKVDKYLRRLQRKVDRATMIATGSQYSADEIRSHLDLKGKDIRVMHHGATFEEGSPMTRPQGVPEGPFLFGVSTIRPRKNFHVLVDMLRHVSDYRLLLAGNREGDYSVEIERLATEFGLGDRVRLLGEVDDSERNWLYQHCEALCFPSLHEGFGLPVIEAMANGKPVFISNRTSLPEVAGDLGFVFPDFEPKNMADVFHRGMETFRNSSDMAGRLKARGRSFTWGLTAEKHRALYRELCENVSE